MTGGGSQAPADTVQFWGNSAFLMHTQVTLSALMVMCIAAQAVRGQPKAAPRKAPSVL